MPVIRILASAATLNTDTLTGLRKGLSDVGYEEGKNVAIVVRSAERLRHFGLCHRYFVN